MIKSDYESLKIFNQHLEDIRNYLNINSNKAIEELKGLLDSVCKTILGDIGIQVRDNWDSPTLIKETLKNLPFLRSLNQKDASSANKIMNSLVMLNQGICELRNNNSFTSHGKDFEGEYCQEIFARLTFESVRIIGNFLFEIHSKLTPLEELKRISYADYKEFNEWYDDQEGEVILGSFIFSASLTLYNNDLEAYKSALEDYARRDKD